MSTVNVDLSTPVAQKDKDATRNYSFDMTGVLSPGDSVATMLWTLPAVGLTITGQSYTPSSTTVGISGGAVNQWYAAVGTYTTVLGEADQIVLRIFITADREVLTGLGSALFPNRFTAVANLRRDRLLNLGVINGVIDVTDDYLWEKLQAAEAQVGRALRVPLQVTQFFADTPAQADIDALPVGMPWEIDPGYDYEPDFFMSDKWGFMQLRKKPVDSIQEVKIHFPAAGATTFYTIPADWLKPDKKYGLLQFVPLSGSGGIPLNAFMLQAIGMGRHIPFSIGVKYRAGLNAAEWPDLIDLVQKEAVLKTLEDRYLPQSGSISADGLSQSISLDMQKYRDTTDSILNGPKGANGGLMAAIHGVRMQVM